MNKDLGVWTNQDCALVLIDYQKEIFATIRSETSAALAELNVRLLARTAKAFNMPIVLSTVGVAARINGPTQPARRRSEEHTSELQSQSNLVCRLLLEKNKSDRRRNGELEQALM